MKLNPMQPVVFRLSLGGTAVRNQARICKKITLSLLLLSFIFTIIGTRIKILLSIQTWTIIVQEGLLIIIVKSRKFTPTSIIAHVIER